MGILNKLALGTLNKLEKHLQKKGNGNVFHSQAFGDFTTTRFTSQKEQNQAYSNIPWVGIAVDAIMRDAGGQPFTFVDKDGNELDQDRINPNILLPFITPYEGISFKEMTKMMISHMLLPGNGMLIRAKRSAFGEVNDVTEQFIPLLPGEFMPMVSESSLKLEGYKIQLQNGQRFELRTDQVVHFIQNRVENRFWGVGNITKQLCFTQL